MADDDTALLIERFIAERGVTRCPAAFATASTAELTEADRLAHQSLPAFDDPTFRAWKAKPVSKRGTSRWARWRRRVAAAKDQSTDPKGKRPC